MSMSQFPLISVIMSTYNENEEYLEQSVLSILNQTYQNIEFIIINDNPDNRALDVFLTSIKDSRVIVYKNEKNMGLVQSLNRAIGLTNGEYVARMDADDISIKDRIEKQYQYLIENQLDMIGSAIQLIDEKGKILKKYLRFPITEKEIIKNIRFGNCLAHPSWFLKKSIYVELHGYRNVKSCEDYDFVLRVLNAKKYRIGNMPELGLKYRVRLDGISKSTEATQYVLRDYLSARRGYIMSITEEMIQEYILSKKFSYSVKRYSDYKKDKSNYQQTRKGSFLIKVLCNRYFYKIQFEKMLIKRREK